PSPGGPSLMSHGVLRTAFVAILLAFSLAGTAGAQQEPQADARTPARLTVGLYVSPPFVMAAEDGRFTGMAVELWDVLAGGLGLETDYVEMETLRELVDAAASGAVDVAVTNLTITKGRVERI